MNYIGIDLGTTNSVICTYDGKTTRIWKSPEQNDVTPSAIFIDKRGNRYYGNKAYNQAPYNPNNSATLFKRFMGTNNIINFKSSNISMTPEECSAEILRVLFGYLPEEVRNSKDRATVITVPAAFNQVKKDATLKAANLAGLGQVALIQEPVAAIMSVMKHSKQNGIFIVFDLGGGTFDVSIAENINGKISLRSHGGIEMCGGRDVDRALFNNIVVPWLLSNFELPENFQFIEKYKSLCRISQWATERAKIELSSVKSTSIVLSETEVRIADESGEEIYLDVPLSRDDVDFAMSDIIRDTIRATKDIIDRSGISLTDIESIVFVGGPTQYKPLRDAVSSELGIKSNIDINPMTAVSEGAAIYAESLEWTNERHSRKSSKMLGYSIDCIDFKYNNRTSSSNTKLQVKINYQKISRGIRTLDFSVEIICNETGWTSGRFDLGYITEDLILDIDGMTNSAYRKSIGEKLLDLPLLSEGDNTFVVKVYNKDDSSYVGEKVISITKTVASINSITASHAIGVEILEKLGGSTTLEFIVKEDETLPKSGTINVRASKALRAGSDESINIKLWEGNILKPVDDNRFIGMLCISGTDFDSGVIPAGAIIECSYYISESGNVKLEVSVPSISAVFESKNFYSSGDGKVDLSDIDSISDEARSLKSRIDDLSEQIEDERLDVAREKVERISNLDCSNIELEDVEHAFNDLLEVKKLLYKVSRDNESVIRRMKLDELIEKTDTLSEKYFTEDERRKYEILKEKAERLIDKDDESFNSIFDEIDHMRLGCLIKQDWFIIQLFRELCSYPNSFTDRKRFEELRSDGNIAIEKNNINRLRTVIADLYSIDKDLSSSDMLAKANILRG